MQISTPKILSRIITTEDLESFVKFDKMIFGEEGYSYLVVRQLYDICGDLMYIAIAPEGEIAGYTFACLKNKTSDSISDSWILALGVDPKWRKQGIAKKLVSTLMQQLTKLSVNNVYLTVKPDNDIAIHLYKSIGFESFGYEENYFGKSESRIIMRKTMELYTGIQV